MIYLLSQIIEASAKQHPHKLAFKCREMSITYQQLDEQSTKLASTLYEAGIRKGDRVGIFLSKSIQTPIAVYGCLKAGAIYIPIDTASPKQRLKKVLTNACPKAILTHDRLLNTLKSVLDDLKKHSVELIVSESSDFPIANHLVAWSDLSMTSNCNFEKLTESDGAYIIYTSGSTGEPKGILHTHRSAIAYAELAASVYGLTDKDILGSFAPLHFDQSTFDYFSGPIMNATTVLIPEEYMRFPASLSKFIDDQQLTIWYSVPTALIHMLNRGDLENRDLSSLRWVLFGGENFPTNQLIKCMNFMPNATFSNVYGPAEVNQCTFYHLSVPPSDTNQAIPIGKLWPNSVGKIVDETDQEVPIGTIGELLVKTPTMMVGYWNKPILNNQCFYTETSNGIEHRYYRTGDLVKETSSGDLLFIGRNDRQVKINGFRIEMNAVESAFLQITDIEKCAVFLINDSSDGTKRLSSAVVLHPKSQLKPKEILLKLKSFLPNYSIPSEVIILQEFPQTGTNKTDYNKLVAVVVKQEELID